MASAPSCAQFSLSPHRMNIRVETFRLVTEGYILVSSNIAYHHSLHVCSLKVTVGVLGILGNISLIWLFSKKKKNFHHLMLTLALYDLVYITMNLFLFGFPNFFPRLDISKPN